MHNHCSRCLLNEAVPGVRIGSDGLCSVCQRFDQRWGDWEQRKGERLSTLEKMFDDCRRKKRMYDVLVPLSGGKDSVYALYLCRKHFNLRCLSVTWDNGFLTDHARQNIKSAVETLGVDHIYYGVNKPLLMRLYKYFFLKTGMFCPVCMRGIGVATEIAAEAFNIPLVVNGTSQRTEEYVAPEYFQTGQLDFFREVLRGDPLEMEASELLYNRSLRRTIGYYVFWWTKVERVFLNAAICLPDYVEWEYETIYKTITSELGWRAHKADAEHTDCAVDNIVNYMRQKKFPVLTPDLLRFSKLVTAGIMSKEDAQRKVCESSQSEKMPSNLEWFFDQIDIDKNDFEQVLNDPLKHMKYRRAPSRLWTALRQAKRLLINPLLGKD